MELHSCRLVDVRMAKIPIAPVFGDISIKTRKGFIVKVWNTHPQDEDTALMLDKFQIHSQ